VENEIFGFNEGDGLLAAECDGVCVADGCDFGFDGGGVDSVGGFAEEAEEDRAVGAVADTGEGERTVEIDGDACGVFEEIGGGELAGEAECGAHGADGVGAGWADTNFEEFEEAGVHVFILGFCGGSWLDGRMVRISLRISSGLSFGIVSPVGSDMRF
jgi:hypothetical protein